MCLARHRLDQLVQFQQKLDEAWRAMRWTMDIITYARDKNVRGGLALSLIFAAVAVDVEHQTTGHFLTTASYCDSLTHDNVSPILVKEETCNKTDFNIDSDTSDIGNDDDGMTCNSSSVTNRNKQTT